MCYITSVLVLQSRCSEYSASTKTPSDSQESHGSAFPSQKRTSETASATSNNHSSAHTSVHGPANTRTFHTSASSRSFLCLQQQRRLKGSLATDGSTILSETSKSTKSSDSNGRDNKTDMQMNASSASSSDSSDLSRLRNDAKKVDSNSRVSFKNFTFFSDVSYFMCWICSS